MAGRPEVCVNVSIKALSVACDQLLYSSGRERRKSLNIKSGEIKDKITNYKQKQKKEGGNPPQQTGAIAPGYDHSQEHNKQ